ncbi:MAG: oligosaccharide flippase family protein [Candidatus Cloacimonetes bacterium]|nr:oligosaccharide flippase family protein [Candidatus Cloacimonadota bacterium]
MKKFHLPESPIKRAFVSVFFGNMITAGLSFLLNVLLSRFLTVAEFGKISLIFSLVITFFTIADFGFSNTTIIFYNRYREKYRINPLHYLNTIYFRFWAVISLLSVPLILIFIRPYFQLGYYESLLILFVFVPFMVFYYLNSCNQAKGRWLQFNLLNVSNKLLQIIAIFLSVLIFYTILGIQSRYQSVLWGYNLYPILLLIICFAFNYHFLHFARAKDTSQNSLADLGKIALPLGITNIFVIISMRFGYLVTEKVLGSEELGIFSAANTLALVFPLITTSLMNVLLRETATRKQDFLRKIITHQKKYALWLLLILTMSIFGSRFFILTIFGENYAGSIDIFRILLIPYIGGIFFTPLQSYFYSHQPKTIMTVQGMQMLIVIIGSILLIRYYGLTGVALAITLSRVAGWIYIFSTALVTLKNEKPEVKNAD